ncbi:Sensor protein FixL [bacterium HR36]|nr:Sensor protein FixL [bacterium HR36]
MRGPTKAQLQAQLEASQTRLAEVEGILRNMRNLIAMVVEALPGFILLLNEQGAILQAELNSEWQQRYPPDRLLGQSVAVLVSPPVFRSLHSLLAEVRQRRRTVVFEHSGLGGDLSGAYEWRLSYNPEAGIVALVRRLEFLPSWFGGHNLHGSPEAMARLNRLARLGELVTSLVHELNQPLTAILNYGQGCMRRLAHGQYQMEDLHHAAQQIALQATRAMQIMERIRRFMRGQEPPVGSVNLNAVVQESLALLAGELSAHAIRVELQLQPQLPEVRGDAVQLAQVLVNLLRNAVEAVVGRPQPRIIITTRIQPDAIEVSVEDNGPGLTPQIRERLFEPFFTTKPQGLGIGLNVSRRIVEAHGGTLHAENLPTGARFTMRLPPSATNPLA